MQPHIQLLCVCMVLRPALACFQCPLCACTVQTMDSCLLLHSKFNNFIVIVAILEGNSAQALCNLPSNMAAVIMLWFFAEK